MNTPKQVVTKQDQLQASHKHAKHLATMHLLSKNPKGAAEALAGLPPLISLEFLYDYAIRHRLKNKPTEALVAIDAADLLARNEQKELEQELQKTQRPLRSGPLYPAHVFEN